MSLPEALERAADRLPKAADAIRDANGDPNSLLAALGSEAATELPAGCWSTRLRRVPSSPASGAKSTRASR